MLGGDRREAVLAQRLAQAGYQVRHIGCPPETAQALGVPEAGSVAAAVAWADLILCPIPGPDASGRLYAPYREQAFYLHAADLDGAAPGAVFVTGSAYEELRAAAQARGLRNVNLSDDEELMVLHSAAVAEGALHGAIGRSDITLHRSRTVLMGFGRQSVTLARRLHALGARVTVVARSGAQRARALEMGMEAVPLGGPAEEAAIRNCQFLFYTIPSPVLTRERLAWVPREALVLVLTAPPGGVDFAAAAELELNLHWLRGLSDNAYRITAANQWEAITRGLRQVAPELQPD